MNAFVSWSGGKDCMLALYRFLQQRENEVLTLINMCEKEGDKSVSHGIKDTLIAKQASFMNMPLLQPKTDFQSYEKTLKETIIELKKEGLDAGVFGDIYLQEHRAWIERVCKDMEIEPVFPLWQNDTMELLKEFVGLGFRTILVSVREKFLGKEWLGRVIDQKFIEDLSDMSHIDPCAENGEYHSFVYDGLFFTEPLTFKTGNSYSKDDHWFIELN